MPLDAELVGGVSGVRADVDSTNHLLVNLPSDIETAGYAVAVSELDEGTATGAPLRRTANVSRGNRAFVGIDTGIFDYLFNATAQDTGVWKFTNTTMTATLSGGFLLLNASSLGTTGIGVSLQTWKTFEIEGHGGQRFEATCVITTALQANQIMEFGLFTGTQTTNPADGAYFRITSAGIFGILNYNGTETPLTLPPTPVTPFTPGIASAFVIELTVRGVEFWIDGVCFGTTQVPSGNTQPFLTGGLPICFQQRNQGTVVGSPSQLKVGNCHLTYLEMQLAMPFSHQQCAEGLMASQGISGGTQGSTALFVNATTAGGLPGAGTVAANGATVVTGLGGMAAVQPTFTAGADGLIFSFQNPAGTITQKPRILMITGVKIMSVVSTVLVGGPVISVYALAYGHTSLSLATAEGASLSTSPTTKAPRRVVLGVETIAATAAVGVVGSQEGIYMAFNSPIAINPGEFVGLLVRNIGTVTSSGVITYLASFDGYWI